MKQHTGFSGRNPLISPLNYDKTTKSVQVTMPGGNPFTVNIFRGKVTSVTDRAGEWMRFRVYVDAVEPWLKAKGAIVTDIKTAN